MKSHYPTRRKGFWDQNRNQIHIKESMSGKWYRKDLLFFFPFDRARKDGTCQHQEKEVEKETKEQNMKPNPTPAMKKSGEAKNESGPSY